MNLNPTLLNNLTQTHAQDNFVITYAPLALEEVYRLADNPANGAIVVMSGTVRDRTDGKSVVSLEYQCYEPMARTVFRSIADQIRQKWQDTNTVVIHHRVGHLQIGEISVLVAVGCPHRTEAFEACRYAIDTLKHNAPIWKKEYIQEEQGIVTGHWVSIKDCC
jgi:molybdopterin synthase catalytic subunit